MCDLDLGPEEAGLGSGCSTKDSCSFRLGSLTYCSYCLENCVLTPKTYFALLCELLFISQAITKTLIPVFLTALCLVFHCSIKVQFQCGTKVGTDLPKCLILGD